MYSMALLFHSSVVVLFIIISNVKARDFFPHGLEFEAPVTLPPSASEFFNTKDNNVEKQQKTHAGVEHTCADSDCSPLPQAAEFDDAYSKPSSGSKTRTEGRVLSKGGVAGILIAIVVVALLGVAAYYVVVTRQANMKRTCSAQPPPHA